MELRKKSVAVLVVIFIAIIAGFFYVSNLPAIDKTYSFGGGL